MPWDKKEYHKKRWKKHMKRLRRYKLQKGCAICGYREHPDALQFDHIKPVLRKPHGSRNNTGSVTALANSSYKKVKEEISKCQVLCANCHSIKTVKEIRKRNEE